MKGGSADRQDNMAKHEALFDRELIHEEPLTEMVVGPVPGRQVARLGHLRLREVRQQDVGGGGEYLGMTYTNGNAGEVLSAGQIEDVSKGSILNSLASKVELNITKLALFIMVENDGSIERDSRRAMGNEGPNERRTIYEPESMGSGNK